MVAHLGLGSNLGDRAAAIDDALARLDALDEVKVLAVSRLYVSEAWYVTDQPDFVNACAAIETSLSARELLDRMLAIERDMGRRRDVPKGPRTIDLDVLLYGDRVIDEEGLTVPHPAMLDRPFVLIPLRDVAADAVHPTVGRRIEDLLEESGWSLPEHEPG